MSEKRFKLIKIGDYVFQIKDIDNDLYLVAEQICNLLNEQQSTIDKLTTKCSRLAKEKDELLDEIGELNYAWSDKVSRLLDFVEEQGQVSRQQIKEWWNDE